jgi:membrane protein
MHKILLFFKEGIWLEPLDPRKPIRSFFIRWLRILYGAYSQFEINQCSLQASALTFYTLLSMVPILAVAFGIAKGFGFEEHLQKQIAIQFKENPEVGQMAMEFAYSFLKQAEGGLIAGIGILVLLWSVLKLLNNIESALNQIWKVYKPRSFLRMISDYLAIMFICPIFIVISSSITIFISGELRYIVHNTAYGEYFTPVAYFIFWMIPLVLSWIVMTSIYLIMPNTRVPLASGLIAGIIAGTVYQLLQWTYIHFQIGVSNYGAIYGSFAALPLFMLWVQLSWMVVLGGAEIAYQLEVERNGRSTVGNRAFISERALAVLLVHQCAASLRAGLGALPLKKLAGEIGASIFDLKDIASSLVQAGILIDTRNHIGNEHFMLSKEIEHVTLSDICRPLNNAANRKVSIIASDTVLSVESKLQQWDTAADKLPQNMSILEVIS